MINETERGLCAMIRVSKRDVMLNDSLLFQRISMLKHNLRLLEDKVIILLFS